MDDDLGATLADRLRAGDLAAAPAVLNLVETRTPDARAQTTVLLDRLSPPRSATSRPATWSA